MGIYEGKEYMLKKDFDEHSVWVFREEDDEDEGFNYPLKTLDDVPKNPIDLFIKSKFITPQGFCFEGYISGLRNIYCIAIFCGEDEVVYLNRNLLQDCLDDMKIVVKHYKIDIEIEKLFPLHYKTIADHEDFIDLLEGEFDIFKPVTNEERLEGT
jgi:hypothetical protein